MRKGIWFWLTLGVFLLITSAACGRNEQWLILYQSFDQDGQPAEFVVIDMNAKEQRRIPKPDQLEKAARLIATHASGKVLIHTPEQEFLVDVQQGSIQSLGFAGEAHPLVAHFRFSGGGKRWMLMGAPNGSLTYLVDLETGQAHDMTTLDGQASAIFYGLFAPDEKYVVLRTLGGLWLVPTANPAEARRLGSGETMQASSFSSDGKQIVYVQRTGTDTFEVVLEALDRSGSETVISDAWVDQIAFVPGQAKLVFSTEKKVSLLSLGDLEERELLSLPSLARIWQPRFAPSGQKALLIEDTGATRIWHLVDLKQGKDQVLEEAEGYYPYSWYFDSQHLFLIDNPGPGKGGRHIASLDLQSGGVTSAMDVDEQTQYIQIKDVVVGGKSGLVLTQKDNVTQLWLVQADGGRPRLLVEANGIDAAFSPDGRWIVVSTLERGEDGDVRQVKLMATEGSQTRVLGEGYGAVWVQP